MRTRRSQFSSDPVSPFDKAQGKPQEVHQPVLLQETLKLLGVQRDDIVVDATLGGAGHARAFARELGEHGMLIGFDLDPDAVTRARKVLADATCRVELICDDFRHMRAALERLGIARVTKVLFDLGWSSYQLDSGRGFSFLRDEPLAMTYGQGSGGLTAARIVNEWKESSLADILFGFGEERYARRIAKAIVARRERRPFKTARELAETIVAAVPAAYRRGRIHPATRTFQALRIAVNDELGALTEGLQDAKALLALGGTVAVISFHSLEDRIVKRLFAEWEREGSGIRLTPKDITLPTEQAKKHFILPSREEIIANRRARSAKLRAFQKTEEPEDHTHEKSYTKDKRLPPLDIPGET